MQTYKHSGIVPGLGAFLAIITGLTTAFVGGVFYAFIIVWCPVIYFCVLATFGFGALIGGSVAFACKYGKIRNNSFRIVLTLGFAALGVYCEWGATSNALDFKDADLLEGFSPVMITELAKALYSNGSWGLGGAPVSGIILMLFWIAEILMILISAFISSNSIADDLPYCETCNRWTQWTRGIHMVKSDGTEPFWQQVTMGDMSPVYDLKPASETDGTFVRFDAATCSTCGQSAFLSIFLVTVTIDKDGDVDKDEQPIERHLLIDDSHIIQLMEANKKAWEEYDEAAAAEPVDGITENNQSNPPG